MAPKRKTTRLNPDATPTPVTDTHTTTSVTNAQIQAMINEGVTAALAARDATQNGDDSHTSGTGVRRPVQVARECTYPDFLKCQPLNFKGTEGVVGLTQWFEKMESVYSISNCTVACQVKFATCTLQGNALTWWNSHVKTTTPEAAHAMPWRTLKKMMTDKYCPRGEIKKLEFEMWNLKVKGNDVVAYSQRFQELALMCDRMFPEEIDQVEKYVGGLPDTIHGSVMALTKNYTDAIEFATQLMTRITNTWAERHARQQKKSDDTRQEQPDISNRKKRDNHWNSVFRRKRDVTLSLANITASKDKDKSKGKRLEDVAIVQEFPKVFPEDLPGIPPSPSTRNAQSNYRNLRTRLQKTKYLTLGSSVPVCKERKMGLSGMSSIDYGN
ncbi:putative reverse transcriptase domain-containing protein [Tanacetum coccineum]